MELFDFDDDYVRRLREGDSDTTSHFYDYFRDLLLLKLRGRLPSMDAIDDVRQEVFLRTLKRLGELREAPKLGSFVNSICDYVLYEYYRAEGRTEGLDPAADFAIDEDFEHRLESTRIAARVRLVMATLPERDAEILRAVFLEEDDKDEICRRFGIERNYLRVLLHRAKKVFRSSYLRRKSGRLSISETFGDPASLQAEKKVCDELNPPIPEQEANGPSPPSPEPQKHTPKPPAPEPPKPTSSES
ncbi:MAG: sigma-70 family RNA polymerase sigma factor [Acidobacteriota bacterium]